VLFGITPIITNKYWARALRSHGYRSISFVYGTYLINSRDDFDYVPERLFPSLSRMNRVALCLPYLCFLWALLNFEVFFLDFDGGFLRSTPFRFLEFPIFALAGRKIIAIPYGGDVLDLRLCRDAQTREAILADYPLFANTFQDVARRVAYYNRWASFILCGGNFVDFLPRFDLLVANVLAIDVQEWSNNNRMARRGRRTSRNAPVTILHAPNHRNIKGTRLLVQACEELRAEGVPVKLVIKQRVPNKEIRQLMRNVDIVASGFITGCYELFAVEGMSMGRPVLNYWRPDLKLIYSTYSYASECPIVDTPASRLKENIKLLVENPDLRERLGKAGRQYVEKYHSFQAVGELLDKVIRKVWLNESVDFSPNRPPCSSHLKLLLKAPNSSASALPALDYVRSAGRQRTD
jgi:glycosyltransferase involved in cell wall biosynthesis